MIAHCSSSALLPGLASHCTRAIRRRQSADAGALASRWIGAQVLQLRVR
jgi:hypothetical protein